MINYTDKYSSGKSITFFKHVTISFNFLIFSCICYIFLLKKYICFHQQYFSIIWIVKLLISIHNKTQITLNNLIEAFRCDRKAIHYLTIGTVK
jgi:hypothetical protein